MLVDHHHRRDDELGYLVMMGRIWIRCGALINMCIMLDIPLIEMGDTYYYYSSTMTIFCPAIVSLDFSSYDLDIRLQFNLPYNMNIMYHHRGRSFQWSRAHLFSDNLFRGGM